MRGSNTHAAFPTRLEMREEKWVAVKSLSRIQHRRAGEKAKPHRHDYMK
jgi:hypothetical protein